MLMLMGTEVGSNELNLTLVDDEETLSPNTLSVSTIPHEIQSCGRVLEDSETATELLPSQSSIRPLTPDSNRENAHLIHDLSSPLTLPSSPPTFSCFNFKHSNTAPVSLDGDNLQTPKETVFDPFAPAPTRFMLSPHPRKYIQGMGTNVVRRLNFIYAENLVRDINHQSSGETISDEEHLFESVYSTILDAIFSEHIKELVANQVSDPDGFRTPKFAPRLSGVAEACPGAPVKSTISNFF
ncbi:uncharacterized protein LOC105174698 isoform X2 [Sesamum indicum]|uniref:Uncharacterized protein LOC105174698 isoform X2 n=1 Tax=Sesamum indicum TaxID=4182 RepID=A0A6I9UL85_SESIN|nr:uncharacterized protein LOC105174698 isoform X2 [Sesamum indicum]